MPVSIHDDRLARLYLLAEKRGIAETYELDPGFGESMWVDSFTNPTRNYYVKIIGEEVACHCKAALENIPCTHAAVCISHFRPSIAFQWAAQDEADFLSLLSRIRTNQLTPSERRRVNKAMRQIVLPEVTHEESEVCF